MHVVDEDARTRRRNKGELAEIEFHARAGKLKLRLEPYQGLVLKASRPT